ncbi:unnamed protein product, partial [Musa acuminata subsp. burmannicoides]
TARTRHPPRVVFDNHRRPDLRPTAPSGTGGHPPRSPPPPEGATTKRRKRDAQAG